MMGFLMISVVVPLISAGVLLLAALGFSTIGLGRRSIRPIAATLAIVIIVIVGIVGLSRADGVRLALPGRYPSLLADLEVQLRWDARLWPLGMGLSVAIGALLFAAVGRDEVVLRLGVVVFALWSGGLAAVWSASPFTTIVCWALYDAVSVAGWIIAGAKADVTVRGLALGTGSGLLLWAGTLLGGGGIGSVPWALMPPGGTKMGYWTLAGLMRLGAYPLHLLVPRDVRSDSPLVGSLFLSPVLGWALWMRVASGGQTALPVGGWTVTLAALTLVAGGVLAWTASLARDSRAWIGMGVNGTALLAAVLMMLGSGGESLGGEALRARMAVVSVGWMLATALLFAGGGVALGKVLRPGALPRSIPSVIGALSVMGVPITVGFVGASYVVNGLMAGGGWACACCFFVGHVLLVAAVLRWLFEDDGVRAKDEGWLGQMASGIGLGGLAAGLVALGVLPRIVGGSFGAASRVTFGALVSTRGPAGWLLWGGAILLGVCLAWFDPVIRPRIALWLDLVHDAAVLDWVYRLVEGAFERGFGVLRVVDDVLGGRGALLWASVLLLVLILLIGG